MSLLKSHSHKAEGTGEMKGNGGKFPISKQVSEHSQQVVTSPTIPPKEQKKRVKILQGELMSFFQWKETIWPIIKFSSPIIYPTS